MFLKSDFNMLMLLEHGEYCPLPQCVSLRYSSYLGSPQVFLVGKILRYFKRLSDSSSVKSSGRTYFPKSPSCVSNPVDNFEGPSQPRFSSEYAFKLQQGVSITVVCQAVSVWTSRNARPTPMQMWCFHHSKHRRRIPYKGKSKVSFPQVAAESLISKQLCTVKHTNETERVINARSVVLCVRMSCGFHLRPVLWIAHSFQK